MNIQSAKYTDENSLMIELVANGKTMSVPTDTGNRHYQAILEWVYDGNSIGVYVAPVVSDDPQDYPLKRYQFLAMVEILGKEQAIMDAIAALPATSAIIARKRYENTHEYIRSDELFAQLAPLIGLTDEQVDEAWLQAKEF